MSVKTQTTQKRIDEIQTETDDDGGGIDADTVFDVLSKRRRRDTIDVVREQGPLPIGELAEFVAAREETTTPADVTTQERKRIYVSLHQCHLPKCDERGVLIYDQDKGRVSLGPNAQTVTWYLDNGPAKHSRSVFRRLSELLTR